MHDNKITEQLNSDSLDIKTWFKLSKHLLNSKTMANAIPPLVFNNIEASTDIQKVEVLNNFFCAQS